MKAITTFDVQDVMAAWKAAKEATHKLTVQACARLREARERFQEATGGESAPRELRLADGDVSVVVATQQVTIHAPGAGIGGVHIHADEDPYFYWALRLKDIHTAARLLETVTVDFCLSKFAAELAARG
jgi:hypothetical protein